MLHVFPSTFHLPEKVEIWLWKGKQFKFFFKLESYKLLYSICCPLREVHVYQSWACATLWALRLRHNTPHMLDLRVPAPSRQILGPQCSDMVFAPFRHFLAMTRVGAQNVANSEKK